MARKGDGLYERGKGKITTWWMDVTINGQRVQKRLGKGISRSVALELASVQRAAALRGELGIGKKAKDLSFDEPERNSRPGLSPARKRVPRSPIWNVCAAWRNPSAASASVNSPRS